MLQRGSGENGCKGSSGEDQDLIDLGVPFDKKEDGTYDLAREGGHSNTGSFIIRTKQVRLFSIPLWRGKEGSQY